jgi:hypothetical protein
MPLLPSAIHLFRLFLVDYGVIARRQGDLNRYRHHQVVNRLTLLPQFCWQELLGRLSVILKIK